jgi:glutamine cyclotransferase
MRIPETVRLVLVFAMGLGFAALAVADDTYRVVHVYPHDAQAFTQGLIYADGHLYESTGRNGKSSLRMVDLETGRSLQTEPVDAKYFAEGLTKWGSTLIQLTWQSHIALVYDQFSFRLLRTLPYGGEGWGLTEDGKHLILSDGTATLHFLDPATLHEVGHVTVKDHGAPIDELNELEYVHGEIYANVWHTDRIARIAPATGKVIGWINLAGLLPANERPDSEAVLNGIAWDSAHDRLFVTGKLWPKLFEIQVISEAPKPTVAKRHK